MVVLLRPQVPEFLGAGARHFVFMLKGLQQLAPRLEEAGIAFLLLKVGHGWQGTRREGAGTEGRLRRGLGEGQLHGGVWLVGLSLVGSSHCLGPQQGGRACRGALKWGKLGCIAAGRGTSSHVCRKVASSDALLLRRAMSSAYYRTLPLVCT